MNSSIGNDDQGEVNVTVVSPMQTEANVHLQSSINDEQVNVNEDLSSGTNEYSDLDDSESDNECIPTPKGHKYWVPEVPADEKPSEGNVFDTFDEAYDMYLEYALKARFSIRKSTSKRKKGEVTHKYIVCNRAGKPRKTIVKDTLAQSSQTVDNQKDGSNKPRQKRNSNYSVTDCKACVRFRAIHGTSAFKLYEFIENHNHPLLDENNTDLLKARRKLDFSDKLFIHRASLSNLGPTKAHRLRVAFMGSYQKVRGKPSDWKNFRRSVNKYIGPRDAQMLIDKMNDRKKHVPNFSFEYHTVDDVLSRMFWADETMKCNYNEFGDVVSFDATYRTNRYRMIFVPFTGIDHNQKCVTFGAALISDETIESYKWILTSFKKAHVKEPILAVTDQDPALRTAVEAVFPEAHHRLCMWHITQKLPGKICGEVDSDSEFKKLFHKLIWNVFIEPSEFEERWHALIGMFNLSENKWLSEMFKMRDLWIPAYFKELPMCCLMKTTSRSESSNAFFRIFSHSGNMLVQFMLCFEAAMEKQRYVQRVMDNRTFETTPVMFTDLPIERHACSVYSRSIFREVQKEILKGLYACSQISVTSEEGVTVSIIQQKNKENAVVINAKVLLKESDGSVTCSCNQFGRHGYLCRHIFCVFRIYSIDQIPERYVSKRWRKDVLPSHLLDKRHRYGPCIEETDNIASDIHATIESCVDRLRNDTEKLKEFLAQVTELKSKLDAELPPEKKKPNNEEIFQDLLGVTTPKQVIVKPPQGIRNKGCGTGGGRFIGPGEKAKTKAKTKKKGRTCSICDEQGHNMRTCKKRNAKKKAVQDDDSGFEEEDYDNELSDNSN